MKLHLLELCAFLLGLATMALEILGLGILAPHFGIPLTVASNLIGIILFSLALGYWAGGKLAERNVSNMVLGRILLISACLAGILLPLHGFVGSLLRAYLPVTPGSFLTIVILFAAPMFFFGAMLPFLIRLGTDNISRSGVIYGRIYALSSLGSVAGTLAGGFIFIPYLTIDYSLFIISSLLLLLSILFVRKLKLILWFPLFWAAMFILSPLEYVSTKGIVNMDGSVIIDLSKLKKIDDINSQYSRLQIYEGIDEVSQRLMRLMRVNHELHSGTFLDSDELVFKYAKFNRLAGHFNPEAKKALLVGGGGYSYANYFLGDTPLFGLEKVWKIGGKYFSNNKTISLPVLFSHNFNRRSILRELVYTEKLDELTGEKEDLKNIIEVDTQIPGKELIVRRALIQDTGFPEEAGFVHVHEVSKNGLPGRVISPNMVINKQGNIIGHSELFSGEVKDVHIPLDREISEGEVLYAMLHRDNGNRRFDPILVDGYEKIEKLDVVEIDPMTTELARRYFHLNIHDPRLRIFHEDGRTFINYTKEKYDIIYFDAFRSFYAVPFQLMTREAAEKIFAMLGENGVMVFNIPSALGGSMGKSFQATYKTFGTVFPELRVFAVTSPQDEKSVQNIVVVGFKSKNSIRKTLNDDPEINEQLQHIWEGEIDSNIPIMTDEFAPSDYYINKLINIPTM